MDWRSSKAYHSLLYSFLSPSKPDSVPKWIDWDQRLGEPLESAISKLLDAGALLVVEDAWSRIAHRHNAKELKQLCRENGLKVSGPKETLIDRLASIDPTGQRFGYTGRLLKCSPEAAEIARAWLDDAKAESRRKIEEGEYPPLRERAMRWARDYAGDLIGREWTNGELRDNPYAEIQITEPVRDMVRKLTVIALGEGMSVGQFASELMKNHDFSREQAVMISWTEMAFADTRGTLQGWKNSDGTVIGKKWNANPGCCPLCQALHGVRVKLRENFPGGAFGPPRHPQCRCSLLSVFKGEEIP
jgi:SPP1 gp7 family putative phage head morphogenesis protein